MMKNLAYFMKGCEILGKYNLLNESWIPVIENESLKNKKVSLIDIFENAEKYKGLAGDTKTQDFAMTRLLLAVLQTVFSRFDYDGKPHPGIVLDEKFMQVEDVDEDEVDDYIESLQETWKMLWESKKFPEIISKYLRLWEDRFYFLDDKHPFYQVRKDEISDDKLKKGEATEVLGKTINRTISESNNKVALFSPKNDFILNKSILTEDQALRWIITYQNYSALTDKAVFDTEKYTGDVGWLFQLGGIYLKGGNLFETLILNVILPFIENEHIGFIEKPCWEYDSKKIIEERLLNKIPNNLAELYTNWARAIYIDLNTNFDEALNLKVVVLPKNKDSVPRIEPMTLWALNEKKSKKADFFPVKLKSNESLWRSFGLLTIPEEYAKNNEIKGKLPYIIKYIRDKQKFLGNYSINIEGTSIEHTRDASSIIVDEIYDSLSTNELVLSDIAEEGWISLINSEVNLSKKIVGGIFGYFISDLMTVRNDKSKDFKKQKVEELYYKLNEPFKDWLVSINKEDEKNKKIREWRVTLKSLVINEAREMVSQANTRDYRGIEKDGKIINIATIYNKFINILNKTIG